LVAANSTTTSDWYSKPFNEKKKIYPRSVSFVVTFPPVYNDVTNWWYHYYSRGHDALIKTLSPKHFLLSTDAPDFKITPNFVECIYDSRICHWQIGQDVTSGKSIVVMKTTVGMSNPPEGYLQKAPYIVGYFRVLNNEGGLITMDKNDSLLLFEDPIKIDREWVARLFPLKTQLHNADASEILQSLTLRNCHATADQLQTILEELYKRKLNGSRNYFGSLYEKLLSQMPKQKTLLSYLEGTTSEVTAHTKI